MPYLPPSKNKPPARPKNAPSSLILRVDRAAGDLNPILIVFVVGLLALNLTFYLGISVSREGSPWRPARQIDSSAPPAGSSFAHFTAGTSAAAGN
jgi:hypothetical protein